jgi:hypothetical protein
MFGIAPKCYILKSSKYDNNENVEKMKGVSFRLNYNIELESYKSCLEQSSIPITGTNTGFMVVNSRTRYIVKYEQKKKAINGNTLDEMIVFENHFCASFLPNLAKEYYFSK